MYFGLIKVDSHLPRIGNVTLKYFLNRIKVFRLVPTVHSYRGKVTVGERQGSVKLFSYLYSSNMTVPDPIE